jgi:hypothetical protein
MLPSFLFPYRLNKIICLSIVNQIKIVADTVLGSDESWLTELDNEAFKDLIALNKTAILD